MRAHLTTQSADSEAYLQDTGKRFSRHCLEVFLLIILQIYKKCFPKLSRDKTRFGQRLKKLDPETAQEIFDDLGNEVEKYKNG
ncbi:unnamed protein product [Caenorhabditis brenneri]